MKKILLVMVALVASAFGQQFPVTGTITGSQCKNLSVANRGTVAIQITGSWSGTIQPQVQLGSGGYVNWFVYPASTTSQTTITANGVYQSNVAGFDNFQICGNTVTGTAAVQINASAQTARVQGGGGGGGGGGIPSNNAGQALVGTGGTNAVASNVILDVSQFSGADDYAKIKTASVSSACVGGCTLNASALSGSSPTVDRTITGSASAPIVIQGWTGTETPATGITLTLGPYVTLVGQPSFGTIISQTACTSPCATPIVALAGSYSGIIGVNLGGNRFLSEPTGLAGNNCILANTANTIGITIVGNLVHDCGASGIVLVNSTGSLVNGNQVQQTTQIGISLNATSGGPYYANEVSDNKIYDACLVGSNCGGYSLNVTSTVGSGMLVGTIVKHNTVMNDVIGGDGYGLDNVCSNPTGATPLASDTGCDGIQIIPAAGYKTQVINNIVQNVNTECISGGGSYMTITGNSGKLCGISTTTATAITHSSCNGATPSVCTELTANTTGLSNGTTVVFSGLTSAPCLNGHQMNVANVVSNTSFTVSLDLNYNNPCASQAGSEAAGIAGSMTTNGGSGLILYFVLGDGNTYGYSDIGDNSLVDGGYVVKIGHLSSSTNGTIVTDLDIHNNHGTVQSSVGLPNGFVISGPGAGTWTFQNSILLGNNARAATTPFSAINTVPTFTGIAVLGDKGWLGNVTTAIAAQLSQPMEVTGGLNTWGPLTFNGTAGFGVVFSGTSSGTDTLVPVAGALGAVTTSIPDITGTLAVLANTPQTFTGQTAISKNGASGAPPLALIGTVFTGGNGTLTVPYFYLDPSVSAPTTWNTSGTMFGINAPSAFVGNFLDFHLNGGGPLFRIDSAGYNENSAQRGIVTGADVTCGTSGTLTPCTAFSTITGLSFTLPLVATNWSFDCNIYVSQATSVAADQIAVQTATNGATNLTSCGEANTAAAVIGDGCITDVGSTTTAQSVITFTPGATGTKVPIHLTGTIEGASASGTVFNVQILTGAAADLLTVYRGSACSVF